LALSSYIWAGLVLNILESLNGKHQKLLTAPCKIIDLQHHEQINSRINLALICVGILPLFLKNSMDVPNQFDTLMETPQSSFSVGDASMNPDKLDSRQKVVHKSVKLKFDRDDYKDYDEW
jgi:hypothetical protein